MKKITNKTLWLFAIGQLGWSLLAGIITNWLVFFYQPNETVIAKGLPLYVPQGTIFLGLMVVGLITAGGRIFDAFTDPWIASLSDRSRNKNGRRIPFMKFAAIPFGLFCFLMFVNPVDGTSAANAWFLFAMAICFYLSMTCYCTPYNALIPVFGDTQKNRINLSTFISLTFIVGTSLAFLLPNIAAIFEASVGYAASIRIAVAIMAAIGVICMLIPVIFIKETDYDKSEPSNSSAFKSLGKCFKNKQFRIFVISDVLYFTALAIFNTGLAHYLTVLMGLDETNTFIFMAIMTAISLLFYVPVNMLAKKVGKKVLVITAFMLYCLVFLITFFSGNLGISGFANGVLISVVAAIPMAILGILPQAIVADISECDALETGERREGMFFAARTFAFKLGQSVAMLIFTSIAVIGAPEGTGIGESGLRITALVAMGLCLLGGLVLIKYDEKTVYAKIIPAETSKVNENE